MDYPYQIKKEELSFPAFTSIPFPKTCKGCQETLPSASFRKEQSVCPNCRYHFPLTAYERILHLVDSGSFEESHSNLSSLDPLEFPSYSNKLKQDKEQTSLEEAVVTGEASIGGYPVVIGVMDQRFRMGSMGSVVGEKITRAIETSLSKRKPFLLFSASGGARMQEGILSLMQMAKTSVALSQLHEQGVLFISVLTNPTTGGVSASFASLGDINIAEPQALIGFAGRRIIEQTIGESLPQDFQTSEFLLEHGQLDMVVDRTELKHTLATLLKIHSVSPREETLT